MNISAGYFGRSSQSPQGPMGVSGGGSAGVVPVYSCPVEDWLVGWTNWWVAVCCWAAWQYSLAEVFSYAGVTLMLRARKRPLKSRPCP